MSEDLAVRAARAEIERDAALARARMAEDSLRAFVLKDEKTMLDTLHVVGIPARDLKDIYTIVAEWHREGGKQAWLERHRLSVAQPLNISSQPDPTQRDLRETAKPHGSSADDRS